MSGHKPSYFIPIDFYPPDGPIKLGQLIVNLDDPGMQLDPDGPLDLEKHKLKINHMPYSVVQNAAESTTTSHVESGLFVHALQFLTGKLGMAVDRGAFDGVLHHIDRLDTQTIVPTDAYVEASLRAPAVQHHLRRRLFRKSVFMVTGVKVAKKGAQMAAQSGESSGTAAGAEAAGGAAQASGGGAVQTRKNAYHVSETSFVVDADFVYAFQVRECHFGLRGVRKDIYTKNALLGVAPAVVESPPVGGVAGEAVEPEGGELEFEFYGVGDGDVAVDDLGQDGGDYDAVALKDEATGETWSCAILKNA